MPLNLSPEYFKAIEPMIPMMASLPQFEVNDVQTRRDVLGKMFENLLSAAPYPEDVEQPIKHQVKSYDGATIDIYQIKKKNASTEPGPAIVHSHGGGMIFCSAMDFASVVATMVAATGVQVFTVDYRLAPEARHPTLVEDVYAGLKYVHEHASDFSVDTKRIAVMGESAGGGIAGGVALMARDRKLEPPLAKQILVYPMLDDRTTTSNPAIEQFLTWKYEDNITGWTALLGDKIGTDNVDPYAAPARVESVEGLPPTYIDVGELDIFAAEDMKYAQRLALANTSTEFHLYPGGKS